MLIFQLHLPHVSPNSMQAVPACPEPFGNYILEGSISISTCQFEAWADNKTAVPKVELSHDSLVC